MGQLQALIKNSKGQLLVEILLAIALTAIILPALITGIISSKEGKAQQAQRIQAVALLKESEEVARNVRNQDWSSFAVDGTYHPAISGTKWTLASGSETINGLTRTITVSDVYRDSNGNIVNTGGAYDPSTKRVVSTITWGSPYSSSATSTLYLTRYVSNTAGIQTTVTDFNTGTKSATVVTNFNGGEVTLGAGGGGGDWCIPTLSITTVDLSRQGVPTAVSASNSGSTNTVVTGTGGNASGPTFVKTQVAGNTPPTATFSGQFNNSKANGVFTEGHYGYIATTNNSQEIQILDLTQFSNPPTNTNFLQSGYVDAPGNGEGDSVYVTNNVGYMTDKNKFYTFDMSSHSGQRSVLNSSGFTLSGNGTKVKVVGNYAFISTDSTSYQLQVLNISNPSSPTLVASASAGTQAGVSISVNATGTRVYLVTNYVSSSQPDFYIIDTTNKTGTLPIIGTYNTSGMSPKGVSVATGNRVIIVGTGGTKQYQVVNISSESAPATCGSGLAISGGAYGVSSVLQPDGFAYSYVVTGDANAELKIILGGAGGQFSLNGTFTSSPIDATTSATFNYFDPVFTQPNQTSLKFQVAVANAVNNSCTNANYTFVGPNGTTDPSDVYIGSGVIPLTTNGNYTNPGRCFEYKAYFTTNDQSSSPTLESVSVNFSP